MRIGHGRAQSHSVRVLLYIIMGIEQMMRVAAVLYLTLCALC